MNFMREVSEKLMEQNEARFEIITETVEEFNRLVSEIMEDKESENNAAKKRMIRALIAAVDKLAKEMHENLLLVNPPIN